ncbi:MAG: Rieske (2Fe-2S) protein [Actinobacteria bacterium]|nr:Rieske (2Fe-2S) protein [Actinomycetota bacterium]
MDFQELRVPRQQFIAGAGAVVAVTALAACSGSDAQPAAGQDSATATTGEAAAAAEPKTLAKTADVPVGSGIIVDDIVVTQPVAGQFKGLSATCTHKGCALNQVADGTIDCPCHGSKFNLDGTVANGPADKPLPAVNITVVGDSIVTA